MASPKPKMGTWTPCLVCEAPLHVEEYDAHVDSCRKIRTWENLSPNEKAALVREVRTERVMAAREKREVRKPRGWFG